MFAVPGWNLPASSLQTQTEVIATDGSAKRSRKRKRGPGDTDESSRDVQKSMMKTADESPASTEPRKDSSKSKQDGSQTKNSDKKKPKKDKKKKLETTNDGTKLPSETPRSNELASETPAAPATPSTNLTPLQSAMRQKLISARFRHLNQTLYTAPSTDSLALFAENPDMFDDYHSGFRQQVAVWPENPIDGFIRTLRERAQVKPPSFKQHKKKKPDAVVSKDSVLPLMRSRGVCTIADLGCGDARLAQELKDDDTAEKYNLKLLSYDLHSNSPHVTRCDVASLPLADNTVDVAIFCLALMGTNWIDFIEEAYRVLHWKGELWVAEIKSRFGRAGRDKKNIVDHSIGSKKKIAAASKKKSEKEEQEEQAILATAVDGEEETGKETDVSAFVKVLSRRGFELKNGSESIDLDNKMFVRLELVKSGKPVAGKGAVVNETRMSADTETDRKSTWVKKQPKFLDEKEISVEDEAKVLKPCLYKIR